MIRTTSTLPTLSCTRSLRSMRSFTGWLRESSVKWISNIRNTPLRLMKLIKHTLFQIAISGQPLNKAIVCHLLETKINSNSFWVLLENFLRLSCFFRTSIDSILLLIHLNKGSCERKIPHPCLPSRRKRTTSDSITSLPCCLCGCWFMFSILSQSSFYDFFLYACFLVFVFCFLCVFYCF